ncbi:MAG: FAD-dependent oxidoreductase [Anaerolineales bacterium]|nr:MAG: FAD-dependent oxidoreductase [Anaerolineales bacterium]
MDEVLMGDVETREPAALVIGAGIAGIQAALDIADAGFKVYLVEKEPSVGGRMAQLDKTFPTLDCSACILTPKMVDVARHPNIELLTYSEVEAVEGEAGRFRVRVRQKPRYVDMTKCTSCGDCTKVCPVLVPNEFDMERAMRHAVYVPFPQAVPNKYVIDKRGVAPCKNACPAHIDVQGYVALIAQSKYKEALALIYKTVPFPGTLGRVCPHPCETACNRDGVDEPVAICILKRFVADEVLFEEVILPKDQEESEGGADKKVAVVGAGSAGLTAAYFLALGGYKVTVFEALPVAGGMMVLGIPAYRLPREVLQEEIRHVESLGVEIRLDTPLGLGGVSLEELRRDYDAVFLGIGAHKGYRLNIPGEELAGVLSGVEFLRDLNLGKGVRVGRKVAVIGGGNVAIDAARSSVRLGAESVTILYRRSRAEMPASPWEVADAEEEGVRIEFLASPVRILGEGGQVTGVECIRMKLGEPDATGRRRPIPVEGTESVVEADTVICAIGQAPALEPLGEAVQGTRRGLIEVNPVTMETNIPGVFAGGDAVSGPATVIEAIAAGKRAAEAIDLYLQGKSMELPEPAWHVVSLEEVEGQFRMPLSQRAAMRSRQEVPKLAPEERVRSFAEVELGLTEEDARAEAVRCLNCAVCSECMECVLACQVQAIDHCMEEEVLDLNVAAIIVATGFDQFDPKLKPEFAYGIYDNVITGPEFERLSSASGPTQGKLTINGQEPRDVVFIHCVGSRDKNLGNEYCSRVCCMYTAKQAHLVREKLPEANITVFYMDVRAFGKGFEEFYDRVRMEGARYRRGNPSEIYKRGDKLIVRAEDTLLSEPLEMEADLVVLATGMVPREDAQELADLMGLSRSPDGFFQEAHPKLHPVETEIEGIYLAGCCQGPKDVPDTVAQGKAAASSAIVVLSKMRRKED